MDIVLQRQSKPPAATPTTFKASVAAERSQASSEINEAELSLSLSTGKPEMDDALFIKLENRKRRAERFGVPL